MNLTFWFTGDDYMSGVRHDLLWVWGTVILSALLALGYCVLAVNWYFQSKLSRRGESKAALSRLRIICLCCVICCYIFYATDMPWLVWRYYDVVLLVLVFTTWAYVFKMRGISLVDERLAQLDELERSAATYREIAELLPHMVWTATEQGIVDFSNQIWREYVGDARTWPQTIHPDEQQRVLDCWEEAIAARRNFTVEARLGGPDVYRTFVVKATPIIKGEAVKWLGACADIEEQKLLAIQKEVQAKQKSFFLNALSHDLRAPLHNVLLNAQLLKMSIKDEVEHESLDMIVENAVAAGDLVAKLLDFAKVGAQDQNLLEPVELPTIVQQVARRFTPLAEAKGLFLHTVDERASRNGDATPHTVVTDKQKLERIISNLVDNAIKYTNNGGITIEIAELEAGDIAVAICDTGPGIPDANVPYLFDEFYQVNNYERDRSKGFGMGLAICRSLASHIDVRVRLAGTSPQGSRFEVLLNCSGSSSGSQPKNGEEIRADRGRRPGGADGDQPNPQETGLCRV
jgi:signal transduction histidine kinase